MSLQAYQPQLAGVWRLAPDSAPGDETQLMALLAGIARTGSIAAAAREQGLSYRHAWGRIERWQAHFGRALVDAGRGSGSRLSPFGARLLALDARMHKRLAPHLNALAAEMAALIEQRDARSPARLTVVASHDLALARLADSLRGASMQIDLRFRGSLEALAALAAERCDMAGFHCPGGALGLSVWSQYLRHLRPRKHRLLHVCQRVQGLMVAKGNPKAVLGLRDLTRGDVRFLNRQRGAGTRLVLDLLLEDQGVLPEAIDGYAIEEYTHAAVAALVAEGEADAGLGIEAAARRFGLDFVPLVEETYFLAFAGKNARTAGIEALAAALAGAQFRAVVAALPGYRLDLTGTSLSVAQAAASLRFDDE